MVQFFLKYNFYLFCLLSIAVSTLNAQWCCLDSTFVIEDLNSKTLRINVSGAINNDLSSVDQGLCGVRIRFDHKYIGDVTMTLVSPSGQRVDLIGPSGNSGYTFFSRWDVKFVNCFDQAIPDPGYSPKWSNLQAWGVFGQFYNGTYYPNLGCLEDFNVGPVNGIWNLEITDHQKFQAGQVHQVCLLFCDVKNTSCLSCSPNAGYFEKTETHFCIGKDSLRSLDWISLPNYKPDSSLYSFVYLVSKNDSLLQISPKPDLSNYGEGEYRICGLSYLISDSSFLGLRVGISKLSKIRTDIILNSKGICAEFSKNCMDVFIHQNPSPQDQNITVCKGDTFSVFGNHFFMDGTYQLNFLNENGCDSIVRYHLTTVQLKADILLPIDEITCNKDTIVLDGSGSLTGLNTRFYWNTIDGNLADTSNVKMAKVNKDGKYTLFLEEGLCKDSINIQVKKISDVPELNIEIDTITCDQNMVTIIGKSNIQNPIWEWRDQNNQIISIIDRFITVVPGIYFVTVRDSLGCKVSRSIIVPIDSAKPRNLIQNFEKPCSLDSIIVTWQAIDSFLSLEWFGPDFFYSTTRNPYLKTEGNYILQILGKNGCISREEFVLSHQKSDLTLILDTDTLNCNDSIVEIRSTFDKSFKKIEWAGPGSFQSNELDAQVTTQGRYFVTVTDYNDCLVFDSIDVYEQKTTLTSSITADKLTCLSDSVQLKVQVFPNATIPDSAFWLGNNFSSNLLEPWVREVGWYYLYLRNDNGCISVDSILVGEDNSRPDVVLESDTLNCITDSVQIFTSSVLGVNFNWIGPDSFTTNLKSPFVEEAGLYEVTIIAANGCQTKRSILIVKDTLAPFDLIIGDTLNCENSKVTLQFNSSSINDSILWTGPSLFRSNLANIDITIPGVYYLNVISSTNGCVKFDSISIPIDTVLPVFQIEIDSVTCSRAMALIRLTSSRMNDEVQWYLPNGDTILGSSFQSEFLGMYRFKIVSENGCQVYDSVLVESSTNKPSLRLFADSITCFKPVAQVRILNALNNLSYRIIRPDQSEDSAQSILTTIPGWHIAIVKNLSDCITIDSIFVHDFTSPPVIVFSDSIFNCSNKEIASLSLINSQFGSSINWVLPNGMSSSDSILRNPDAGKYIATLTNQFGCSGLDSIIIFYDTTLQLSSFTVDTFSCEHRLVEINWTSSNSNSSYKITGTDTSIQSNILPIILNQPGDYKIEIEGSNFCKIDTVFKVMADTSLTNISILYDSINCYNQSNRIILNSNDSILSTWTLPDASIVIGNSLTTTQSGLFYYQVKLLRNGCLLLDSINIGLDTMSPIFELLVLDSLNCQDLPIRLQSNFSSPDSNFIFQWTSSGGQFLGRVDSSQTIVKQGGRYFLTMHSKVNGCESRREIDLTRIPTPILAVDISLKQDLCLDYDNSLMEVINVVGGNPPFYFSLDSLNYSDVFKWQNLTPGSQKIFIRDSRACNYDTSIFISTTFPLTLKVESDTTIAFGSSVSLKAIINKDSLALNSIIWFPSDFLDCINCLSTIAQPDYDIEYQVMVEDTNGCLATDLVKIVITKEVSVFWPNAFSPNGDLVNDDFFILLDESVLKINEFSIYDRWGNRLFQLNNALPINHKILWDGSVQGKPCIPGVYVFHIDFDSAAGEKVSRAGQFTIIR